MLDVNDLDWEENGKGRLLATLRISDLNGWTVPFHAEAIRVREKNGIQVAFNKDFQPTLEAMDTITGEREMFATIAIDGHKGDWVINIVPFSR